MCAFGVLKRDLQADPTRGSRLLGTPLSPREQFLVRKQADFATPVKETPTVATPVLRGSKPSWGPLLASALPRPPWASVTWFPLTAKSPSPTSSSLTFFMA